MTGYEDVTSSAFFAVKRLLDDELESFEDYPHNGKLFAAIVIMGTGSVMGLGES